MEIGTALYIAGFVGILILWSVSVRESSRLFSEWDLDDLYEEKGKLDARLARVKEAIEKREAAASTKR